MSTPRFTIITAVYNGRPYITDTINSVLRNVQDFSHEYLVVDDGSTDGTHLDLVQFGDSIKVFSRANSENLPRFRLPSNKRKELSA